MASIVCSGFTFTEGPTWLVSGNKLLFSDFQFQDSASNFQGRIMQLDPAGQPGQQCTEFLADVGANGLAVAPSGNLLAARHLTQAIGTIDPSNPMVTDIVSDFMGQAFSSPNDLTVRSDGTIYFTDPAWQLGNRTQELDHGVYRVDPQGNVSLVQSFPDRRPNGIVLSPDESKLYVSMIDPNQILVMDVAADGTASNPQTFVDSASDGMTVDCAGNLYATSLTVNIYDPTGQNIGTITLEGDSAGLPDPTNVAFGGANRTTLYVTGSGYVRSVELQIPGYPF
jgi:gluconolactonase